MAGALRGWIVLIILFGAVSTATAETKRVLLLHSFGPQFAPWSFIASEFREELTRQSPDKIDLYEESLQGARFQQLDEQGALVDYLGTLFASEKLDLIVTMGAPAAFFVQKYRARFFPSVPLVIGGADRRALDYGTLTSNEAPVVVENNFNLWVENILEVVPDTNHVVWVIGNSPLETFWVEQFRAALQTFADRVSFEWLNDLPFEKMLTRVSELPPHSAVFYVSIFVDAAGVPHDSVRMF